VASCFANTSRRPFLLLTIFFRETCDAIVYTANITIHVVIVAGVSCNIYRHVERSLARAGKVQSGCDKATINDIFPDNIEDEGPVSMSEILMTLRLDRYQGCMRRPTKPSPIRSK
jgi:hypothetical protein